MTHNNRNLIYKATALFVTASMTIGLVGCQGAQAESIITEDNKEETSFLIQESGRDFLFCLVG